MNSLKKSVLIIAKKASARMAVSSLSECTAGYSHQPVLTKDTKKMIENLKNK